MKTPIIYTCAFRPFSAEGSFWWRDSGLICRALQKIGIPSKAILPVREGEPEDNDIIRGTFQQLTDSSWWREIQIDAAVFTTWGWEGTTIIEAAKKAGIVIILSTDDPEMDGRIGIRGVMALTWHKYYHLSTMNRAVQTILRSPYRYYVIERRKWRKEHQYGLGDLITCYSPLIWERTKDRRFHSLPVQFGYPANTNDSTLPTIQSGKYLNIIAVAEWIKIKHKRPHFLMDACKDLLTRNPLVNIHIYGEAIPFMQQVVDALPTQQSERIFIHGVRPNAEIVAQMAQSAVAICPSAFDGGPVPMAEALCQGCSVVGAGSIVRWASLCGFGEYVINTPQEFSMAINSELRKWSYGWYNRVDNAMFWREYFSATRYAERIRDFVIERLNG